MSQKQIFLEKKKDTALLSFMIFSLTIEISFHYLSQQKPCLSTKLTVIEMQ